MSTKRFGPALREQTSVRALVYGLPGSGKTWGCIKLAVALAEGGRVAVIDCEPEAPAHYYADLAAFDRAAVVEPTTAEYLDCLEEAAGEGYAAVVVDGLTPHWEWATAWHDELALTENYKGNDFAAWGPIGDSCNRLLRAVMTLR